MPDEITDVRSVRALLMAEIRSMKEEQSKCAEILTRCNAQRIECTGQSGKNGRLGGFVKRLEALEALQEANRAAILKIAFWIAMACAGGMSGGYGILRGIQTIGGQ